MAATEITIRNLAPEDVRTIFEIGLVTFDWLSESVFWSERVANWYCENSRVVSFVAESDRVIVGFILCFATNSTGCVEWVAVDEQFRRQGIASRLVHRALAALRVLGVKKVITIAREDGQANQLFRQLGFYDYELRKVGMIFEPTPHSLHSKCSVTSETSVEDKSKHMQCSIPEYDLLATVYDVWATADPAYIPSRDFYVQLCAEAEGVIVELGVGTGRIAVEVAKRNRSIIGVDISTSMLEQCRGKAAEAGVQDSIKLIKCDIRSFTLCQKAHLIILPFRSIGHFLSLEDKNQVLQRVYDQLVPGGQFVFDHYIFNEQWARNHDGIPRLMYSHLSANDGGLFIWDTYRYDFATQQMSCFITIERSDNQGKILEKSHCPLSFSWILPEQVRRLALEIGFEVAALYGDFSYADFSANSPNQVWVLRRPV